jgi:hypothetical protein
MSQNLNADPATVALDGPLFAADVFPGDAAGGACRRLVFLVMARRAARWAGRAWAMIAWRVVKGKVVIPAGSKVYGRVESSRSAGRAFGQLRLGL